MRAGSQAGFAWVPGIRSRASRLTGGRIAPIDDERFSDEDILTVVRAGETGLKLPELCRATGIDFETYCAWKALYSGLSDRKSTRLNSSHT